MKKTIIVAFVAFCVGVSIGTSQSKVVTKEIVKLEKQDCSLYENLADADQKLIGYLETSIELASKGFESIADPSSAELTTEEILKGMDFNNKAIETAESLRNSIVEKLNKK